MTYIKLFFQLVKYIPRIMKYMDVIIPALRAIWSIIDDINDEAKKSPRPTAEVKRERVKELSAATKTAEERGNFGLLSALWHRRRRGK